MAIENEIPDEQIEDLTVTDRETPVGSANDINVVVEGEEPAVEDGFDADAEDGDGDGFVQDGTPHQRPVEEK